MTDRLPGALCGAWLLVGACESPPPSAPPAPAAPAPDDRPNILLIVADDLGYADLGSFGSAISTPHLDALAQTGLRATRFHTAPMCAPTRSMLLSGNDHHVAGMATQNPEPFLREHVVGYEGHLSDRVAPLPRLLRDAGYHTLMAGKWHLGVEAEHSPRAAGFEHSFALMHGAGNHFDATGFFDGGSIYREDGEAVPYPTGRYSTELYTDRLIAYIDAAAQDGRPFFAYAAYTSPHWPLQVPDDELDRYAGRYDRGYDAQREENFAALQRAGIVEAGAALPPRNPAIPPWSTLSAAERRTEAREMELYAAMVEDLDRNAGRLLDHLKDIGEYDHTVVIFLSDNGAAGEDFYEAPGPYRAFVRGHYDNSLENMGRATSWVSYGPPWAEASSAPFSRYKTYTREGGIVAPLIVSGPGVTRAGAIDAAYLTVMDVAPTVLEAAGVSYPATGVVPLRGVTLWPWLRGAAPQVHGDDEVTAMYLDGRAYLRQGRWKLVNLDGPFAEADLELFDVVADPGETRDRRADEPELYGRLLERWRTERRALGIVLPEDL